VKALDGRRNLARMISIPSGKAHIRFRYLTEAVQNQFFKFFVRRDVVSRGQVLLFLSPFYFFLSLRLRIKGISLFNSISDKKLAFKSATQCSIYSELKRSVDPQTEIMIYHLHLNPMACSN
jgi:hypothetical protein